MTLGPKETAVMRPPSLPTRSAGLRLSGAVLAGATLASVLVLVVGPVAGQMRPAPVPPAAPASDEARLAESRAAFVEVASVLTHPRCQNCHTLTDFPRQGNDRHRHLMNVRRGPDGHGLPGMACATCHGRVNNGASGVPGADEDWHLAPLSMGWEGVPLPQMCANLKDPAKNGGRSGEAVLDHLNTHLVEWAWNPGRTAAGRERSKPPLTHAEFVRVAARWVETGAACPVE